MSDVTRLLSQLENGDSSSAEELLPLIYDELRKLAAARLKQEKPGQTIQATALVHDAYMRLVGSQQSRGWDSRGHFFAAAAEAMRRILIDRAREKRSQKRGGELKRQELADIAIEGGQNLTTDILALNEALERFEQKDPAKAKLVKLRYFAGLSIPQAAESLQISTSTADRHWAYARAWLHAELRKSDDD